MVYSNSTDSGGVLNVNAYYNFSYEYLKLKSMMKGTSIYQYFQNCS